MLDKLLCKCRCHNLVPNGFLRRVLLRRHSTHDLDLKGRKMGEQKWLIRQNKDPYVKKAREEGYRCRSAYKLLEINDKKKILKPNQIVVDCGAAPGSWTQVAVQETRSTSADPRVIAIDLLPVLPVEGAVTVTGDFTASETSQRISEILAGRGVDVVISDMAPTHTGVGALNQDLTHRLCLSALTFAAKHLRTGGSFVCKQFQGSNLNQFKQMTQSCFKTVDVVRPKSTRKESSEIFVVATGFGEIR